jgi:hypothetical protein
MSALAVRLGGSLRGALVLLQPGREILVRELEEEAVEDKLMARNDAEHVHKLLGFSPDEVAEDAAVDVGREDGEVDVRIRVRGVEEAEERHRVGRPPELQDLVHVHQVLVERPVLVPALARPSRLQDLQQPRQARVDRLEILPQKRPALRKLRCERIGFLVLTHSGNCPQLELQSPNPSSTLSIQISSTHHLHQCPLCQNDAQF